MGLLSSLFGSSEREKPRRRMVKDVDNYWMRSKEETKRLSDESEKRMADNAKNQRKVDPVEGALDKKREKAKVNKEFWGKVIGKKRK